MESGVSRIERWSVASGSECRGSTTRHFRCIPQTIVDALREPGVGIGKPEPLGQNLSGYWPRRISDEHRLVYTVGGDSVVIIQARYHY